MRRAYLTPLRQAANRCWICIDSTRFISTIASADPAFPLGYVELPRRYDGWRLLTTTRVWGYVATAGAPDEGWETMRLLVSQEAALADAWTTVGQGARPRIGAAAARAPSTTDGSAGGRVAGA